jgi:hypothetical protein
MYLPVNSTIRSGAVSMMEWRGRARILRIIARQMWKTAMNSGIRSFRVNSVRHTATASAADMRLAYLIGMQLPW